LLEKKYAVKKLRNIFSASKKFRQKGAVFLSFSCFFLWWSLGWRC